MNVIPVQWDNIRCHCLPPISHDNSNMQDSTACSSLRSKEILISQKKRAVDPSLSSLMRQSGYGGGKTTNIRKIPKIDLIFSVIAVEYKPQSCGRGRDVEIAGQTCDEGSHFSVVPYAYTTRRVHDEDNVHGNIAFFDHYTQEDDVLLAASTTILVQVFVKAHTTQFVIVVTLQQAIFMMSYNYKYPNALEIFLLIQICIPS